MFGYSITEITGQPSSLLIPDFAQGQPRAGDFSALRKDGNRFDVEATCGSFDSKTTIFLRDISERKRAQKKLEDSEESLRLTVETIPGLVYTRLPNGDIDYANCRVIDYFGKTLQEIRMGALANALHPDERESVLTLTNQHFATAQPYTMEYRHKRFDGVYRWFQTSLQPLKNRHGEVIRWYGLLTDIDDRKNAEESLRVTQAKLSQAAQIATISELSASVVHEISQPLSAMVANGHACIRWLSANPPNVANGKTAAERVVRDGRDAAEIVKGLRALFKRTPPQKTPLDLKQIVDEVMKLVRGRAEKENISVDIQLPGGLPQILGDRIQLQQVLMNLVLNAVESMQANGNGAKKLIIRCKQQNGMVLTEVEDCGPGIADFEKIFETFFTTKENGMGMGLPICRSIIEAHDGRLWAAPAPSAGTVFSFTIPRMEESIS
jgi:hypothetical protein